MNYDETTVFLGFAKGLDYRIQVDDLSISSWHNILPPELTLDNAIVYAREHYLDSDRTMMPAHIASRHYATLRSTYTPEPKPPSECECVDGWELITENGHSAARKCSHK